MASYPARRSSQSAPARKSIPVVWFGFLAVAILAAGALMATLKKGEAEKAAALAAENAAAAGVQQPFSDLPDEVPPARSGGLGDPNQPFSDLDATVVADSGIADVGATWTAAQKLAAEGEALFQEALTAKGNGETTLLNERGAAAKSKFDTALEMTALLEENLAAKRGETDKTVRDIQRQRSAWFDRLRWLHKSTGR